MEPLLWGTSVQGTPPFRGHKIWKNLPGKIPHIIFVSVTSVEGTPLFRGNGQFFWVTKPRFNLHLGDTLVQLTLTLPTPCYNGHPDNMDNS